jgi:hypothetical protein
MRRASLIAVFVAAGCGGAGALSSSESALISDSETSDSTDDSVESGVEEPLSGSDPTDPGAVDPSSSSADLLVRIKTNPGRWFTPAGCIVTTIVGNVATSVFTNCKGPLGLHTYNGTVTSTWTQSSDSWTVTHHATSFKIDNATLDHDATIVYTKTGTTYSRHRSGATSGTTGGGEAIDHNFDWTVTYDPTSKCITRDGSADATIGGRAYSASITGYKRCGVGDLGCPQSGTVTLSREMPKPSLSLRLEFPGGASVDITRPNGTTVERGLLCNPNN